MEKDKAKEGSSREVKEVREPNEAKESDAANEGDEESAQPTPKFAILRRADSGTNDMVAGDENDGEKHAQPTDDRAVKPKEIVRTPTAGKANGSWRNGPAKQPVEQTTTAELEEDGWSTVSKPKKQSGRRHGPARAAAS